MFKVCVVVVVHSHDHVHCFGNTAHPRIHLYNKDSLTHFDALPPAPALPLDGAMASGGDAHVSPERYVVSETSADDTPIALPPRCSARDRGTARMQTNQRSLKRKPTSSSSSSSSNTPNEHSVPYIHTPPHQHTPYTTLCSAFSDGAAKPAPFGSWHSGER